MIRYRTLFIILAAVAVATPTAAAVTRSAGVVDENPRVSWLERYQESRQGPEQTEQFTETYKVPSDGVLDLTNLSGDVRIVTGRNNEVRVEAIKRVRHRDASESKRYLSQLRIEVTHVGDRVEIRTVFPRTSGRSLSASVDYTITVPQGAAIVVKNISGDAAVNGVRGEVRLETVSGDIDVVGTPNLASAKAISGDVRARDISSPSTLSLGTVSGSVIVMGLKVRALDAGSISGDVQLSNVQVERLSAKTVSGGIMFDGNLSKTSRYEFNAHSGNVRLVLANPAGFELDASTFSGSIRSDFPVTLRSTAREDGRRVSNRSIRGSFGDASAVLTIRSFSGTVVIAKK